MDARVDPNANVFDAVRERLAQHAADGRPVLISGYSDGSADRLRTLLGEHGVENIVMVTSWAEFRALPLGTIGIAVLPIETGVEFSEIALITEQDILGDSFGTSGKATLKGGKFSN